MTSLSWVVIQYNQCPSKKGKLDTERKPCEEEGKDQGDTSRSHGMSKIDGNHQTPGERCGTDSHPPTFWHLDLRLWASRTGREYVSIVWAPPPQFVVLCMVALANAHPQRLCGGPHVTPSSLAPAFQVPSGLQIRTLIFFFSPQQDGWTLLGFHLFVLWSGKCPQAESWRRLGSLDVIVVVRCLLSNDWRQQGHTFGPVR